MQLSPKKKQQLESRKFNWYNSQAVLMTMWTAFFIFDILEEAQRTLYLEILNIQSIGKNSY